MKLVPDIIDYKLEFITDARIPWNSDLVKLPYFYGNVPT